MCSNTYLIPVSYKPHVIEAVVKGSQDLLGRNHGTTSSSTVSAKDPLSRPPFEMLVVKISGRMNTCQKVLGPVSAFEQKLW